MKITLLTPALVAILGLALAGAPVTAQAQTSTNSAAAAAPTTPSTKATKPIQYSGSITAIDASSVTVASKEKTLTLAITPATKFRKGTAHATVDDFAVGDKVTGSYTKDETGAMTAYSLHKKTVTPAATTAAPATTNAPAAK